MNTQSNTRDTVASKQPSHIVYHVRESAGGKGFWTRIGAAWTHADGNGLTIQLDIVPLDGRVTLRIATDESK